MIYTCQNRQSDIKRYVLLHVYCIFLNFCLATVTLTSKNNLYCVMTDFMFSTDQSEMSLLNLLGIKTEYISRAVVP